VFGRWRERVAAIKREVAALALAARDRRTPWAARLLILAIVAYAVSPIDLIPDFIPVLGLLDELVLLPMALALAIRMIPMTVLDDARSQVAGGRLDPSRTAAVIIVLIWLALAAWAIKLLWPVLQT